MRIVLGIITAICLSGCITTYETNSAKDMCVNAGMTYEGFTIVNDKGGGHVRCVNPTNDEQKCSVMRAQAELNAKKEYNSRWNGKRTLIGIGYVFYVVPGYLLYQLYADDAEADREATNKKLVAAQMAECEKTTAH